MRAITPLFAAVVVFAASPLAAQSAAELSPQIRGAYVEVAEPVVALTNARVVDGTGASPRDGQTILIRAKTFEMNSASAKAGGFDDMTFRRKRAKPCRKIAFSRQGIKLAAAGFDKVHGKKSV